MDTERVIEKTNYQTQVYNLLENMIIHGKLKPGQRLIAAELAVSLGVSRSPVREAIVALSQDRLVDKNGNGWVVSKVSLQDIIESYEVRKLIEIHAGEQGCLNCPPDILDEMKTIVNELDSLVELETFREKDRRFHELIVLSAGNKKFYEVFLWARRNIRWCGYLNIEIPGRREQTASEHRAILKGFLNRDPDYLKKAIQSHISSVQKTVTNNWDKYGF